MSGIMSASTETATACGCEAEANPGAAPHQDLSAPSHFEIFENVHLVASSQEFDADPAFSYFTVDETLSYISFADDFGPMSLATVYQFCETLDQELETHCDKKIAMVTSPENKALTNAVFLIGAYMIMRRGFETEAVMDAFTNVMTMIVPYRDVSPGPQNFNLHVWDCWGGLLKAKKLGWVDFVTPNRFDLYAYLHYDDPLNADLHEIVPGKFVAMRGPKDLPHGMLWEDVHHSDGSFSHRDFSPEHYVEILQQYGVQAVVRLNTPHYTRRAFVEGGVAVADLFFEDCTTPPMDVVAKFLAIAEGLPGALAVHCKAGLGRTGTLIAMYMMKHYGFTARQAMGWLRIVRPGSVIGPQQNFLCERENVMFRAAAAAAAAPPPDDSAVTEVALRKGVGSVEKFIDETVKTIDRRMQRAMARVTSTSGASSGSPGAAVGVVATSEAPSVAKGSFRKKLKGGDSGGEELAAHVSSAVNRRSTVRATAALRARAVETVYWSEGAVSGSA